ncbi:hypothetical protein KGY79_11870 [Candidatus Bipolaricaulota bacterium]|nr:hypothetical protein [Candidatus Bipolaricaulota bacterium]
MDWIIKNDENYAKVIEHQYSSQNLTEAEIENYEVELGYRRKKTMYEEVSQCRVQGDKYGV